MEPRIEILKEKKLVGMKLTMSLSENKTHLLWKSFMPRRKEIKNNISTDLISMKVHKGTLKPEDFYQEFDKWSAVEVTDFNNVPDNMESFILNEGVYAVFPYKGLSTDNNIFIYIFGTWLPNSGYILDNRPQFEILGEKYRNNDPNSEEEIWIPIKKV